MSTSHALSLIPVFCVAFAIVTYLTRDREKSDFENQASLPPGPRPLPVVGNVIGFKTDEPWATYTEWSVIYGDILYSRFLGQEIIVISSEELAKALLERRSSNYSDRPFNPVMEPFGLTYSSAFMHYGNRWRLHRRLFHQVMRAEAVLEYRPLQLRKARQLLIDLLDTPEDYVAHLATYSNSIVMDVVYGYEAKPRNDPVISVVERSMEMFVKVVTLQKAAIVGSFPFLLSLPSWLPGASLKREAISTRRLSEDMIGVPFRYVQQSLASGNAKPSMVANALQKFSGRDESGYFEQAIKESSGTAFGASSETSSSTMLVFILAMINNPRVQERAQAEIDSVVGADRLPNFEDRSSMPFVDAVLRETLRWHPVLPLGVPHAATDSDVFEGYFIPRGATILPNAWAMSRNEEKYPGPEEFRPERFLSPDGELNDDTVSFAFGFGRRICVGRYLADASIWSAVVSMLAVFKFAKPLDDMGREVEIDVQWSTGITSHPVPFPCRIIPRVATMSAKTLGQMTNISDSAPLRGELR
ncbi:cytochrome P450 [Leucogyrophana mollusca]|uniref:Cytochrome P450 n=1 Tax=Leucogyrophana mollusca TaxID=85980 RepID=A0ACB8BDE2_9AGAM|nr:cytochrome P450 [Leucogyrophana mollusca]